MINVADVRRAIEAPYTSRGMKESMARILRRRANRFDRWWLQPDLVMREGGLTPDAWQTEVLESQARNIQLVVSRQAGKSQVTAALAIQTAMLHAPALILILSKSIRQASELFQAKLMPLWKTLKPEVKVMKETALQLTLSNGSRILSLPGSEETIRCFSAAAMIIIDEAARTPDFLFKSVRPMVAVSRGRTVALSTPWGRRGWFYEQAVAKNNVWKRWILPWTACPRISQSFINEERLINGDLWVRQEYEVSFEDTIDAVFASDQIEAALKNSFDGIDLDDDLRA